MTIALVHRVLFFGLEERLTRRITYQAVLACETPMLPGVVVTTAAADVTCPACLKTPRQPHPTSRTLRDPIGTRDGEFVTAGIEPPAPVDDPLWPADRADIQRRTTEQG